METLSFIVLKLELFGKKKLRDGHRILELVEATYHLVSLF